MPCDDSEPCLALSYKSPTHPSQFGECLPIYPLPVCAFTPPESNMRFQTFLLATISLAVSINAYWLEDITRKNALVILTNDSLLTLG